MSMYMFAPYGYFRQYAYRSEPVRWPLLMFSFQISSYQYVYSGADPRFLDRGFKLAEGGSICAVCLIFPEIPHENEII